MAKPGPKAIDPEIRFWRKVQKKGPDECWIWQGGKAGKGYGQFYVAKRQPTGAHRFSWSIANGPIPDGMQVLHTCDNPPCVNPRHLWVGSVSDNMRDKSAKGRNPGNPTRIGCRPGKWSPSVVAAMRSQGLTYRDIGEVLDIAPSTALRTARRA